jgi:hypothetical protein
MPAVGPSALTEVIAKQQRQFEAVLTEMVNVQMEMVNVQMERIIRELSEVVARRTRDKDVTDATPH